MTTANRRCNHVWHDVGVIEDDEGADAAWCIRCGRLRIIYAERRGRKKYRYCHPGQLPAKHHD